MRELLRSVHPQLTSTGSGSLQSTRTTDATPNCLIPMVSNTKVTKLVHIHCATHKLRRRNHCSAALSELTLHLNDGPITFGA